jgi:hypothetical protein
LGRYGLAAACSAVLAAPAPSLWAAPVVVYGPVTDPPLTTSSTSFTELGPGPQFNTSNTPVTFSITINDPNAYGGNYRFFTNPAAAA